MSLSFRDGAGRRLTSVVLATCALAYGLIACSDDTGDDEDLDGGSTSSSSSSGGPRDGGSSGGTSSASSSGSSSGSTSSSSSSGSSGSSGGTSSSSGAEPDAAAPDASVSCESVSCGAHASCTEANGAATCGCDAGYAGDGATCTDLDECTAATDDCADAATCSNTEGSFTCACPAGFAGDGKACTDVDECTDATDDCDPAAACSNVPGGFTCTCPAGYTDDDQDGTVCTDVDECADATDDCAVIATCTNTEGSYTCACPAGAAGDGTACSYPKSCAAIYASRAAQNPQDLPPSGIYSIDPVGAGAAFQAYCDMTTQGGGWTLALKADGSKTTFGYDAALWTNTTLYQPTQIGFDLTEAKLDAFDKSPFTKIMIVMNTPIPGTARNVVLGKPPTTNLQAMFAGDAFQSFTPSIGRDAWKGLMGPTGSLQPNCNSEGINQTFGSLALRIGITSNNESTCGSNDSWIGLGGKGNPCGAGGNTAVYPSVGNVGATPGCDADNGEQLTASFGYLFVHD